MKKLIDFKRMELVLVIQEYADIHCEGNFNMAVRQLASFALAEKARVGELDK